MQPDRIATVTRKTKETDISLTLNLDGKGKYDVKNPIGFFGHLLDCFCWHGLFDLSGSLSGDLYVDQHHLIEDTGLVLGECFQKALGDFRGIKRTGFCIMPMDESLLQVAVDFSGRPMLVAATELSNIPLVSVNELTGQEIKSSGSFQTDCFVDFWQGFVAGAGCNLHMDTIRGRSDHHKMEGFFKAAARAFRQATEIDPRLMGNIPSTKGVIKGVII